MTFTPLTKIIAAVDNLTKTVFALSADEYLSGKLLTAYEGKKWDKAKRRYFKVYTQFTIKPVEETPIDMFDRAVFAVYQTARSSGLNAITPAVIYRILAGKYSAAEYRIKPAQIEMVMDSIRKLAAIQIAVNMTDAVKYFDYKTETPNMGWRVILPCEIKQGIFNGGTTGQLILFTKNSALTINNSIKKQFTTFEISMLDIGNKRHTRAIIAAKFYTATYIMETLSDRQQKVKAKFEKAKADGKKADPPLARKILYSTLLEKVGMTGASDYVKRQICGAANAVANNFNTAGKLDGIIIDCKTKDGFIEW